MQIIVTSPDSSALEAARKRALASGGQVHAELPLIQGVALDLPAAAIDTFDSLPGVEWAPDLPIETLPEQPGTRSSSAATATTRAPEMWQAGYQGQGVNVAVIDTGITNHKDLAGRLVAFQDFVGHKSKPYDDHGHGTHVAGIVAGDGTDSKGKTKGVAPQAGIVAVKAFDRDGKARSSDVIQAIQWVVDKKDELHIGVLNLSAEGKAQMSYKNDPLARAAENAWAKGLVCVVAVGNEGPDDHTIGTPAHAPHVLSVGGSDDRGTVDRTDDKMYSGSGRGPTPVDGLAKPDLVAPGVDIKSLYNGNGGYVTMTGTSMAAPMVAGTAALLLQAHPAATNEQIKSALVSTAEHLAKGGGVNDQGAGLVDAWKAHQALA